MKILEVAGKKVIELPLVYKDKSKVVRSVETALALLTYEKIKPRTIIIPGNPEELEDKLPGGLVKVGATPEGTMYTSSGAPGVQFGSDIFYDDETIGLLKLIFEKIKELHPGYDKNKFHPVYQYSWFFICKPDTEEAEYHEHSRFHASFPYNTTDYTWVYYLQLPDNCEGTEGKLEFKSNLGDEPDILDVKEDTVYIFPADLFHRPNLSPNSSRNRITVAGNICIPTLDKSLFTE